MTSSFPRSDGGSSRPIQGGTVETPSTEGPPLPVRRWSRVLPTSRTSPTPTSTPVHVSGDSTVKLAPVFRKQVMLDREQAPHTVPLRDSRSRNLERRGENSQQKEHDGPNSPNATSTKHRQAFLNRHPSIKESGTNSSSSSSTSSDVWESYVDSLDSSRKTGKSHFGAKPERRGSLIQKMRAMPEDINDTQKDYRAVRLRKENLRKNKVFVEKKISVDVYIPSLVSVGQLAQLLNVRLGKSFI